MKIKTERSRKKNIINRAEEKDIELEKQIEKTNKIKSCFFGKIQTKLTKEVLVKCKKSYEESKYRIAFNIYIS